MEKTPSRYFDWFWLLCWGLLSSVWCLGAAYQLGVTFDEPGDVASGLEFWRTGSHAELLRVGAMPLPMDICALPIHVYERTHDLHVELNHGDVRLPIFLARTGTLVFWWLMLFYGWRAAGRLGGPWAGRLAVALLACEPILLAHASLATKDIAISACLLAMLYHFRLGRDAGWWHRVGVPGIWFGIALLAKASALAFAPICMLAVEVERLVRLHSGQVSEATPSWLDRLRRLKPWVADSIQIGLLGLAVTFVYCGSDWKPEHSWVAWARQLPADQPVREPMVWLSEHVCIFANAGSALVRQISHNLRGHDGAFILGKAAPRFFWYYFPVALSMKLTLGLLLLPLVLAAFRPRSLTNAACVAAGVLLAYSLKCNVQIGVRLMLPLVVLGIVGLAAALVQAWHTCEPGWHRQLLRATAVLAVGWAAVSSARTWPDALGYTNEIYGGTERGYLCLSDSNYDWGQGLPELADWQRGHGGPVDVWYFGTDPVLETLPLRRLPLHLLARSPGDIPRLARGHYLAASTTLLYGSYLQRRPAADLVEFLRGCQPVARTRTFLIYDFTK